MMVPCYGPLVGCPLWVEAVDRFPPKGTIIKFKELYFFP